LPEAGQTLKNKFETCPKLGKHQKINLRLAHGWASLKEIIWALAPLEYTPRKKSVLAQLEQTPKSFMI